MNSLVREADRLNLIEIKKYGNPSKEDYDDINKIALNLAKKLKADILVVKLGSRLMDLKLGQSITENKMSQHISMSIHASKQILDKLTIDKREKVLACIKLHHGSKRYPSLEAEICANADAYRFLLPDKFRKAFYNFSKEMGFEETLKLLRFKVEEKYKAVTLDLCKKELDNNYSIISRMLR
ncbi:MAG: hypothetical protein WCV90_02465 [Candidatus Woesearchaeota archaeon]